MWAAAIGGIASAIGIGLLAVLTGAWSGKETTADHRADIVAVRSERFADSASLDKKITRILDIVCTDHPTAQQCPARRTP